jgi:hypothetical protein
MLALLGPCLVLSMPLMAVASVLSNSTLPRIDFAALGLVGVAGSFAGLQLYDPTYQASLTALNASNTSQTLWSRSPEGRLLPLGSTEGNINAICQDTSSGLVYLGGQFTSIASLTTDNIASYDPSSNTFVALSSGLDGPVLSLFCGKDSLIAGGTFQGPVGASSGYAGSVASWSYSSKSWSPPTFGGLKGAVNAITASTDDSSTFYGGNFTLSLTNGTSSAASSSSETVASLGSSLTPISLNTSYLWAGPTGSGDPYSTFCPTGDGSTGSAWLTPDNTAAIFVVRLYTPLQAGGLRIGNTFRDGRGTKQFKYVLFLILLERKGLTARAGLFRSQTASSKPSLTIRTLKTLVRLYRHATGSVRFPTILPFRIKISFLLKAPTSLASRSM